MPKGYRLFFTTAFGWLILAAATNQPNADAKGQQPNPNQSDAASDLHALPPATQSAYRPYPEWDADACYQSRDKDVANQCAYWRSARAAERANVIAILASILATATLLVLLYSIGQTRGALREARRGNRLTLAAERRARREARDARVVQDRTLQIAERNACAAENQAAISTETAYRQLRAYVTAEFGHVEVWREEGMTKFRLEFVLRNSGKTNALLEEKRASLHVNGGLCRNVLSDKTIVSPGSSESVTIEWGTGGYVDNINIICRMFMEYRDYLGHIHSEDSCWFVGPPFIPPFDRTDYIMICHNKIDETIARFIDPDGEAERDRQIAEAIATYNRMQDLGVSALINGQPGHSGED